MLKVCAIGVLAVGAVVSGVCSAQTGRSSGETVRDMEVAGAASAAAPRQREAAWETHRRRVEGIRKRLHGDIAELSAIREAQAVLVKYVEAGGGTKEEALDARLCRESALRPLCPELEETFGEMGR